MESIIISNYFYRIHNRFFFILGISIAAGDVKDDIPFQPDRDQQEQVFCAFVKEYPNLKCIARHVRFAHSCSENSLLAYLWKDGQIYESRRLTFHILDRVGGGDAFVSGM